MSSLSKAGDETVLLKFPGAEKEREAKHLVCASTTCIATGFGFDEHLWKMYRGSVSMLSDVLGQSRFHTANLGRSTKQEKPRTHNMTATDIVLEALLSGLLLHSFA